jgi:serine/threonine protein kinase
MPVASAADLLEMLRQTELVDAAKLDEFARESGDADTLSLIKELIRRGWLTKFQIEEVLRGRGDSLVLGPFHLLDRLGAGGMGQVFKGRHQIMQRLVALKIMRPEMLKNEDAPRRFLREAQAAARLNHPNIVTLFDAGDIKGTFYLAMELIDGTDLAKHLRASGPLPIASAADYLRQVAEGLHHAHSQGLVHRDVKPSNLLLARDRTVVKILDMGLARFDRFAGLPGPDGTLTREGSVLGTFDYLSPEQAKNAREVDARADLYSLGCTFYHLVAGRPPFPGESGLDKLIKHQLDEPAPLETLRADVPPCFAALIHKLMAKRPEDRFANAAEAAAEVRKLSQTETMELAGDTPYAPLPPSSGPRTPTSTPTVSSGARKSTTVAPRPIIRDPLRKAGKKPPASRAVRPLQSSRPVPKPVKWVVAVVAVQCALIILLVSILAIAFFSGRNLSASANDSTDGDSSADNQIVTNPSVEPKPVVVPALEQYLPPDAFMVAGINTHAWLERPLVRRCYGDSLRQWWKDESSTKRSLEAFSVNPWEDVDRIMLAWEARHLNSPLILLRGRFNPARVHIAGMKVSELSDKHAGTFKLYECKGESGQPRTFVAIANDATLLVGSEREQVVDAVERGAKGVGLSLKNKALRDLFGRVDPNHDLWLIALGAPLAKACETSTNLFIKTTARDIFRYSETLHGGLAFADEIQADLFFTTSDPETAKALHKQLDDTRNFIKLLNALLGDKAKDAGPWPQALEAAKIITNGRFVHVHARLTEAEIEKSKKK